MFCKKHYITNLRIIILLKDVKIITFNHDVYMNMDLIKVNSLYISNHGGRQLDTTSRPSVHI